MVKSKVDLRELYRRIGRLQTVADLARRISDTAFEQLPLEQCGAQPYYLIEAGDLRRLGDALDVVEFNRDTMPAEAGLATVERDRLPLILQQPPAADEAFVLTLPFQPDRELSANKVKAAHWTTTSGAFKAAKEQAVRALSEWIQDEPHYRERLGLHVQIYWGRRLHAGKARAQIEQERDLDWDGVVLCMKPILDALTEVRIWHDDRLVKDSRITQHVDPDGAGKTVLTIWRLES